jgi:hypothetical protein
MKVALSLLGLVVLAGCSGKDAAGGGGRNELAATACETYAKGQLADKTYQLDHAVLAQSLADTPGGGGTQTLKSPITIDPGLSSESKQTLECTVRFVEGREAPDVINLQFIW